MRTPFTNTPNTLANGTHENAPFITLPNVPFKPVYVQK